MNLKLLKIVRGETQRIVIKNNIRLSSIEKIKFIKLNLVQKSGHMMSVGQGASLMIQFLVEGFLFKGLSGS